MPDHPTDYCPILQGETSEIVFTDGTFPGPAQIPYNPYDKRIIWDGRTTPISVMHKTRDRIKQVNKGLSNNTINNRKRHH
ncbi:hypothetical protein GQ457_09G011520 [Hibiscus cannabinus]